jgi:hypothetical protein
MVLLTKLGVDAIARTSGGVEGPQGCLAVAKAADGPLECFDEVVFDETPHLLSRGGC